MNNNALLIQHVVENLYREIRKSGHERNDQKNTNYRIYRQKYI